MNLFRLRHFSIVNLVSKYLRNCANCVDPDEVAHPELSHHYLHCLPFHFLVQTENPICINGHVQIQGWKSPLWKFKDERVK